MFQRILKKSFVILVLMCAVAACKKDSKSDEPTKTLNKGTPLELNYENVSTLIGDMQRFQKALRPLDRQKTKAIDERYKGVFFELKAKPLFVNVYPDLDNKRVVFLITPKDAATGASYELNFDKDLPVVKAKTIEVTIRLADPEEPLTCWMSMSDPSKYVAEIQSHLFTVRYKLYKKFLQSGTFDFDALTLPTYRVRGMPFIVFDLDEAELTDTTTKVSCKCQQM